jgi:kynurenine formamidase
VQLRQIGALEEQGWRSHWLSLMGLNGTTYLEPAAHLFQDGPMLAAVTPEKLITRAYVVKLPAEGQQVPAPEYQLEGFRRGEDSLLLHLGWEEHLQSPLCYDDSPYFSPALQEWILACRPAMLGADTLSFDHPDDEKMPFVRALFGHGGMILCPLVGLGKLPTATVTLCALPIKITGASAAPCRVLAW